MVHTKTAWIHDRYFSCGELEGHAR